MSPKPRTTFDKLQKERARLEKQAAKRAKRQGRTDEPELTYRLDRPSEPSESQPTPPTDA